MHDIRMSSATKVDARMLTRDGKVRLVTDSSYPQPDRQEKYPPATCMFTL